MTTTGVVRDTPMLIRRDFNSYASPNMKAAVALAVRVKLPWRKTHVVNTKFKLFRYSPFSEQLVC